jgi:hypothetical protein
VDILNKQICGTGFFADKCLSRNKNITCRLWNRKRKSVVKTDLKFLTNAL